MKTKVLKFAPSKLSSALNLTYAGQFKLEVETVKFLGLQLDSQVSWKCFLFTHRSSSCITRRQNHVLTIDSLKLVYFAYCQSEINYGVILLGNSTNLNKVFLLQKRYLG
jgi:hypothetical protein